MATKILVVDDEKSIAEILKYSLEKEGYQVSTAFNGWEALEKISQDPPHLVILDIMLPHKDGLEVCQEVRASRDLPIIMLTAKETEIDKVVGLELGADDYITKPFSTREVIARVRAILRRTQRDPEKVSRWKVGNLELDADLMEAYKDGERLELTLKEFYLLQFLMEHQGQVFSREKLLNQVWGYDYIGEERTVDVTVRRLREKIEEDTANPEYIFTKRGIGYYFRRQH